MKKLPTSIEMKVAHWDDERADGGAIVVCLKYGYRFSSDPLCPVHVEGFDTVRDAKNGVKWALRCDCADCKKGGAA